MNEKKIQCQYLPGEFFKLKSKGQSINKVQKMLKV